MPHTAIVYVPPDDLVAAAVACLDYATARGYRMRGVVVGRWGAAQQMALDGTVDIVIVAERSHLPADRVPRIEVVAEQPPPDLDTPPTDEEGPPAPPPRRRRPKPI